MAFQDYRIPDTDMDEKLIRIQQILEILENEGFIERITSGIQRRNQRNRRRARRTRKQRKKKKRQGKVRFIKDYKYLRYSEKEL